MPGLNGTGPVGRGPMTGGGRGYCTAQRAETFEGGYGRTGNGLGLKNRFGRGCGRRRGLSGGVPAPVRNFEGAPYEGALKDRRPVFTKNTPDETSLLKTELAELKGALEDIRKTIAKMQGGSD